jgi:CRP/FNR family transcriptional regulator, cyclic AMP receptor protein
MTSLASLADGHPRRTFEADTVLIVDGEAPDALYVLLDGALRIEKGGAPIAIVAEPGTCVGEMSLLLGIPATADVVAVRRSEVAVIEDAAVLLEHDRELALALARLLASRLQAMTTYLADLKHQYGDHEGGLGMIDVVLGSLMRGSGSRSEFGSERDPEPEY